MKVDYSYLIYIGLIVLMALQFGYLYYRISKIKVSKCSSEVQVISKGAFFWLVIFLFIAFSPIIIDGVIQIRDMYVLPATNDISENTQEMARLLDNYKGVMYTIISVFILFGMSNAIINWSGLSKLKEVEANLKLTEAKLKKAVKQLAEAESIKLEIQEAKIEAHSTLTDVNNILENISEMKVGLEIANKEAREAVGNIKATADDEREFNNAYFDFNNAIEKKQLEESTESLKDLVKLVAENSENSNWQGSLADCYLKLGDLKMSRGNPAEAESYYNDCLLIRQKLAQNEPDNSLRQSDLAQIYSVLASIAKVVNEQDTAQKYHKTSIRIMENLVNKNSLDNSWQYYLAAYCNKYGNLEIASGHIDSGRKYLVRASEIFDKLYEIDPLDIKWQKHNIVCYKNLAAAYLKSNNLVESKLCIDKALSGAKQLLAKAPSSVSRLRIIAFCYNVAGELKFEKNELDVATEYYELALASFDKLISKGLIDLTDQHEIVMLNYNLYVLYKRIDKVKAHEYAQIGCDWLDVLISDKELFFDYADKDKLAELSLYLKK